MERYKFRLNPSFETGFTKYNYGNSSPIYALGKNGRIRGKKIESGRPSGLPNSIKQRHLKISHFKIRKLLYYLKKIVYVRNMKYDVTILNFHVVNSSSSKVRSILKPSNIENILDNSNTARGNTTAEQTPMVNVIIGVLQRHHENDVPTPLEFSGQRIFETTSSTTSGRQFQNATAHCT